MASTNSTPSLCPEISLESSDRILAVSSVPSMSVAVSMARPPGSVPTGQFLTDLSDPNQPRLLKAPRCGNVEAQASSAWRAAWWEAGPCTCHVQAELHPVCVTGVLGADPAVCRLQERLHFSTVQGLTLGKRGELGLALHGLVLTSNETGKQPDTVSPSGFGDSTCQRPLVALRRVGLAGDSTAERISVAPSQEKHAGPIPPGPPPWAASGSTGLCGGAGCQKHTQKWGP